jgi:hypothetical protein
MRHHAWSPELDRPPSHPPPRPASAPARDRDEVLALQETAGNQAVTAAIHGTVPAPPIPSLQRQPKKKKVARHVREAQAELARLFPKDKLLGNVNLKDYGDLNKVLTSTDIYGAWTNSPTEIYIKDTSGMADPKVKDRPKMYLRYILKHEAVHIGQFATAKGPPTTWERMLEFEKEAYKHDLTWLAGSEGKTLIPNAPTRKEMQDLAQAALTSIDNVFTAAKGITGPTREDTLYAEMLKADLIPKSASKNPQDLYQQP